MTNGKLESGYAGAPEVWGGVECTVNRVGDRYFDQLERGGHAHRISDLRLFADLGIKALRYPVLWERIAPDAIEQIADADWGWADERLCRLRELGVRPIVGLVHHGSGPRYTDLLDPEFADKLAVYAGAVARRFPWIEDYTPVNEPLTTARFSGLYGFWYPHRYDDRSFARMLINECRGVALAMRAVRAVNPRARLMQTEDLGKTHATPRLKYQAEFENHRRWLTFDLLCGLVTRQHPLWSYFIRRGIGEAELCFFLNEPCAPDIIGVNYYVTSERFIDHRLERYPAHTHGGNSRELYADTEAVRVRAEGTDGLGVLLREAWGRYGLPIAVTEAHLGCTREEQMRWLAETWEAAKRLRAEGVDVRAFTIWALLGMHDWSSLLTRDDGVYEPGAFDLRGTDPRPTALAHMARDLAHSGTHDHPALDSPGWWRKPTRLIYPPVATERRAANSNVIPMRPEQTLMHDGTQTEGTKARRVILITGATGTLGRAFTRLCAQRDLAFVALTRGELDIADAGSIRRAISHHKPWAIINAAGFVRVDDAERERDSCFRENAEGARLLAAACARGGARLVTFSTDLVFDGVKNAPYVESDDTAPLNVYGASKRDAETCVLDIDSSALVIRTSAFFGLWDQHNFLHHALRALANDEEFAAADDLIVSPTYVPDLVHATLDLLIDGERGVWHLANSDGAVTWAEFARRAARLAGLDERRIVARPAHTFGWSAARPAYSALTSERGVLLPSLDDALVRYTRARLDRTDEATPPTGDSFAPPVRADGEEPEAGLAIAAHG